MSAIHTIMNRANEVSYHFVISREGQIIQAVDIANTAWANGTTNNGDNRCNSRSTLAAVRERHMNANLYSVSIGFGDMPNGNPSPAQLTAAVDLIRHIRVEVKRLFSHTIPFDRLHIVGHDQITPITRPNCPSRNFPWDEVMRRLEDPRTPEHIPPSPEEAPDRRVTLDILGDVQEIGGFIGNGTTYVRLRDVGAALGYAVTWDGDRRLPVIDTAGNSEDRPHINAIDEAEQAQANADLRLLKVITHWEARGESEKGQILVVNVIKNRVAAAGFPNTIHDVVFDSGAFTPTTRADFNDAQPNARTISAVHRALNGEDFSQGATFFHSISGIQQAERGGWVVWHERAANKGRLVRLFDEGNHRFYREV